MHLDRAEPRGKRRDLTDERSGDDGREGGKRPDVTRPGDEPMTQDGPDGEAEGVAELAQQEARQYIQERYGESFLPPASPVYQTKARGAQEAHEADERRLRQVGGVHESNTPRPGRPLHHVTLRRLNDERQRHRYLQQQVDRQHLYD